MRTVLIFIILCLLILPISLTKRAEMFSYADETNIARIEVIRYDNDKATNDIEYFGWAATNASANDSVWKIMRMSYVGSDFTLEWLSGEKEYVGNWNNRLNEDYK